MRTLNLGGHCQPLSGRSVWQLAPVCHLATHTGETQQASDARNCGKQFICMVKDVALPLLCRPVAMRRSCGSPLVHPTISPIRPRA
jgi:hypothetical protein